MDTRVARSLLSVGFALALFAVVNAQVPWNHPDGSTHWYLAISSTGISWDEAQLQARQLGGHLATITSADENTFVFGLIDSPTYWTTTSQGTLAGPWIGSVQPSQSPEPAGGWTWVTGEALAYYSWSLGQPNDQNGNEDRVHFGETAQRAPTWNDAPMSRIDIRGYVVEWSGHSPYHTVGVIEKRPQAHGGYTAVTQGGNTHLIDRDGRRVHTWTTNHPSGQAPYLLDDGDLIRCYPALPSPFWNGIQIGGLTGRIERHDWQGNLEWAFDYVSSDYIAHHDIEVLPNGNVLVLAFEKKTMADALAAGRDPAFLSEGMLFPEHIIEVAPTGSYGGTIVWEWHAWDHMIQNFDPMQANYGDPTLHPELIDVNFMEAFPGIADWHHANSIAYNAQLDQIVISLRNLSEVWIIDHSTTTAQAAGHTGGNSGKGGDLLYRWGNPRSYGAGTSADQTLFGQHDARWIPPGYPGQGNLMIFNNGFGRPAGPWSSVEELVLPVDAQGAYTLQAGAAFGPVSPVWSFTAPHEPDFFSPIVSGAQRLSNGNTLVCYGVTGNLFEVTPSGQLVWRYMNPFDGTSAVQQGSLIPACNAFLLCNFIFRANHFDVGHPGFTGRTLTPGDVLETFEPRMDARRGRVNLGVGPRADVLLVNGSAGDVWREVYVPSGGTMNLELLSPPAGPALAEFTIYAFLGEPSASDLRSLPAGLGDSAFPMPLFIPPATNVFTIANTTGDPGLGVPLFGVTNTPVQLALTGVPPGAYTLQGLIQDAGSVAGGASVTNAIVINVQ